MMNYKYVFAFLIPMVVMTAGGLFAGSSNGSGIVSPKKTSLQIAAQPNVQVQTCGVITTVAGNGTKGYSNDGMSAQSASLCLNQKENSGFANQLAVDGMNNIFFPDVCNHRIKKVSATGVITTVAGNGNEEGEEPENGSSPKNAVIGMPEVVVLHNFNLYLASNRYGAIMKVENIGYYLEESDPVLKVVANNTPESKLSANGIAFDAFGNLFFSSGIEVFKIESNGSLTRIAGNGSEGLSGDGGPAMQASFKHNIHGIAFDSQGNLYIADTGNSRVRKVEASNGFIAPSSTITTAAEIPYPTGLVADKVGNIFISDSHSNRVLKMNQLGEISAVAGGGDYDSDHIAALEASLSNPRGLAFDLQGNLYIAESDLNRIRKVTCVGDTEEHIRQDQEDNVTEIKLPREEKAFVRPSGPPQGRTVSPASQGRAKLGVSPILKKAMPAERTVAKPSLLQRIKSFFSPRKTGPTSEDIK